MTTHTRRPDIEDAIAALTPNQLQGPHTLTDADLPHGVYARAVREKIDPLWGLAGDEPGLFAELEGEIRDAGLSEHEPPMAVYGAVEGMEREAKLYHRDSPRDTILGLIEDVPYGFAPRCLECGELHDSGGTPICNCDDADDATTPTSATA